MVGEKSTLLRIVTAWGSSCKQYEFFTLARALIAVTGDTSTSESAEQYLACVIQKFEKGVTVLRHGAVTFRCSVKVESLSCK